MATMKTVNGVHVHPSAEISERAKVGEGTYIWNQAQIREGVTIGKKCILGKDVYIDLDVTIGDYVKIQNGVSVFKGVTVEEKVFLGPHMTFTNDMFPRALNNNFKVIPTIVKRGASIGANATIVCGVTIGEHAMVGAGSVVNDDIPPHALVVGNPAVIIGFVCECGQKLVLLEELEESVRMKCNECGNEYKINSQIYNKINLRKKGNY